MSFYERRILPKLVHWACSQRPNMRQREKVVPLAKGDVLEIGVGSGLNLRYYDTGKVRKVWGLEPSPEMTRLAEEAERPADLDIEFIDLPGEEIPLDDSSVDTVLVTYTLCTIPDVGGALEQMARVLREGGELVFCEHGAAPDDSVRRWQDRVNPLWRRVAGGCHLNRPIPQLIEGAGFEITSVETMYLPGWRPGTFNYWGRASRRGIVL